MDTVGELERANSICFPRFDDLVFQRIATTDYSGVDFHFDVFPIRLVFIGDNELCARKPYRRVEISDW